MDQEGRLTGPEIAYIYPDYLTVLLGRFTDGQMEAAQEHLLAGLQEDQLGVKVPTFQRAETADHLHLHRRQIGGYNSICDGTSYLLSLLTSQLTQSQTPPLLTPTRADTSQWSSPG